MLSTGARRLFFLATLAVGFGSGALSAAPCVPSPTRICLSGGRFAVEATWKDVLGTARKAQALALPGTDAGSFWFFAPENPELAVKVLDGRPVNGFFWVFYAGLTSLPTKIAVTDTVTSRVKTYDLGAFASQGDTGAFRGPAAKSEALDRLAFPGDADSEAEQKADLVADFTFSPGEPRIGEPISFTDRSAGTPDRWCWIFGDETGSGCTSEQPDAVHSYARAGTYSVRLSVGRTDGPSVLISEIVRTVTVGDLPPPPPLCTFEISPKTALFELEGGSGSVRLTTSAPDCPWTVEGTPAFVNSVTPRSGTGSATIDFQVERNDTGNARTGNLVIAGQTFRILQNGQPCTFEIDPGELILTPSGQTGVVAVDAPAGCGWKASIESGSDFISHLDPISGSGPGVVRFQVGPNPGDASRTGILSIAARLVRVIQLAADVDFFFTPSSPGTGEPVTFFGRAKEPPASWCWTFGDGSEPPGGCAATTAEATHTYVSPANFAAKLKVIRNDGTVAEVTKVVIVSGAPGDCDSEISPRLQSLDSGGGEGEITVTAAADCAWTAQSKAPFVTITAGSSGSGAGTVTYRVDENESPVARTGVLRVAGRIFLVLQKGKPCVRLDPISATALPGGGEGTVAVTAPADCSWATASNDSFLQVASAASQGSGIVRYRVDPNTTGASRTGRLTIGGVDFPVTQDPCVYTSTSTSADPLDTAGGIGTVQIETQKDCPWHAVAADAFLGFPAPPSGKGSGAFEYCVAANRGAARQGTITIADGVVDVPQAGFDPAPVGCHQDDTTLCLLNGRFEVRAAFHAPPLGRGVGRLMSLSGEAGYVTFFDDANLEVLLKMIDGRTLNDHFWLFYGALSNVGYVITASDTETGQVGFYCNPTGTFRSLGDTSAFPPP